MSTRQRKGVLRFQQKPSRPLLTREKCRYWLDLLPKIVKIGTEFEINLPEPTEHLRTDSTQCVHHNRPCVNDCANMELCLTERHPAFCSTHETGIFLGSGFKCPATDSSDSSSCRACSAWALQCRSMMCASFTPQCTVCPDFSRKGQQIENADIRQDPETVRAEMKALFRPSENVGRVGRSGALSVVKDGSLPGGGIEVPTVGRRLHWQSFYNMCSGIIDPIVARGGFVNERCGQHFHILTAYFEKGIPSRINELEEPLPEIVLANLHQLHRRYELAMFWIMSAGEKMEHLTRWARFRQSGYRFSALRHRMEKVQKELAEHIVCMGGSSQNGKYASVAYHFCNFDDNGDVETLHIENRIADGCLSPAVVTAWAMMCYALVIKAVRLSQYGIMEVGDDDFVANTQAARPHLIGGEKRGWEGSRHADTSGIGPSVPFLRELSRELIQILKPELHNMGPAFHILMDLAERPCSLRRTDGDSWDKIEDDLYGPYAKHEAAGDLAGEEDIRELVDLAGIVECDDLTSWIEEVAANLGRTPETVETAVNRLLSSENYRWSEAIGALITT